MTFGAWIVVTGIIALLFAALILLFMFRHDAKQAEQEARKSEAAAAADVSKIVSADAAYQRQLDANRTAAEKVGFTEKDLEEFTERTIKQWPPK